PPQWTPLESQNGFWARIMVVTVEPLAMVPVTAALATGIELAPAAAPPEPTVKPWPATVTVESPATATESAATGIAAMLPLNAAVVEVRLGSSGGRSSLLRKPPLIVRPLCHVYTPPARKKQPADPPIFGSA